MATKVCDIFGNVYTGQSIRTSDILTGAAVAPGLQRAAEVPWCHPPTEEDSNAPARQDLRANVRQNPTGGNRQGNKSLITFFLLPDLAEL